MQRPAHPSPRYRFARSNVGSILRAHRKPQSRTSDTDGGNPALPVQPLSAFEVAREYSNEPEQGTLEKGDFTRIAATMRDSGEAFVAHAWDQDRAQGPGSRMRRWHDGPAGGETWRERSGRGYRAQPCRGGEPRCEEQGLSNLRFAEGDATNLAGLPNKTFDLVVGVFGAMFAPRPFDVAKEMVRVTRPGGRIIMGNWIPNDPTLVAQILKISAANTPPPPEGFISPMTGGSRPTWSSDLRAPAFRRTMCRSLGTRTGSTFPPRYPSWDAFRRYHSPTRRVRGGGKKRPRRRSEEGIGRAVREPEHQPMQGCHFDPGDLPASDSCA